ncbi:DegT/DnrJ/EryC1/StrS family aminotransferase [Snuella sedimenti]|uniref:Aminotransferase class V-fold PLP-dependent enzyme n=1 Tax=Snuella sedimenti TaxID=2798802 RepID=A0A8J7J1T7_9FLAO|nr:aminotransferase class V-fold PLP-dependent enzyme [Snuella sedimenti]MBJ6368152.1 aminotransferase class V-fold PLP-dependent enzyme [Snuella sedimenti]
MIPIFKPYMPDNVTSELEKILYSGRLAFGENGKEFEQKLSNYIGTKKVLTISSYNHALLIILSTLGLQPGDEVIASPVSCLASNQPFAIKGLKVIWTDVEPNSGTMSPEDVKKKITKNTKAIFHNHYCGYLGHINEINAIGKEHGIPVIDDCIEAFGSELNNKKTGNLGTAITVFSFQTVRLPNTIDGGALVFEDEKLFQKAKLIRDYGIDRSIFRNEFNEINTACDIKLEGYGALMSEINSLIGLRQIDHIDTLIQKQRDNASVWMDSIEEMKDIKSLKLLPDSLPNYWVYGIIAKDKYAVMKDFRGKGFYATSVHINNNIYSVFENRVELKGVNEFMNHFVAIPCGWWFTNKAG